MTRKLTLKAVVFMIGAAALAGSMNMRSADRTLLNLPIVVYADDNAQDTAWQDEWTNTVDTDSHAIKLTKYNGTETAYRIQSSAVIGGVSYQTIFAGGGETPLGTITDLSFESGVKLPASCYRIFGTSNTYKIKSIDLTGVDTAETTNVNNS